ncbi:chondroitinase-B domain-containing protein [Carboxylicivirga sp. RSCT41]|uniref:chondroitinase-B domain-containing protein n=1 Tax=Carboxylicivirga agarovorans TaxID=3417570 RepID=UPI003D33A8D2
MFNKQICVLLIWILTCTSGMAQTIEVNNTRELELKIREAQPGTTFSLSRGEYKDIQLIVEQSGTEENPVVIKAKQPGQVVFCGDVKVELKGDHITLSGIYFRDGARDAKEWRSHGPGLVAIYGSYNRVTQCAFHCFDTANSAYVTTSVREDGTFPTHCRIDHCSFTEKITFDQVINLNNTAKADKTPGAKAAGPMYHRIDHCFFANPKKPGNAGGGIRIGYWRKDDGRCLVDSNLFMRQDSEPEIITSKSRENVYYANTFLNCRGTLNFRHGDKQVAINNFFIGDDTKYEYGGMFVWGSEHLIAANYFELPTTIKSRGNAALYLNPGARASEHALAFNISICNNTFGPVNGHAIHFQPLTDRRMETCSAKQLKFEYPSDIRLYSNAFAKTTGEYTLFKNDDLEKNALQWSGNISTTKNFGMSVKDGIMVCKKGKVHKQPYVVYEKGGTFDIPGIPEYVFMKANSFIDNKPLTFEEVGPHWLTEIPGTYAQTGKLSKDVQQRFKEVISKRTNKKR